MSITLDLHNDLGRVASFYRQENSRLKEVKRFAQRTRGLAELGSEPPSLATRDRGELVAASRVTPVPLGAWREPDGDAEPLMILWSRACILL